MLQWHIVTSDQYKEGTKNNDSVYFLSDTKQIYRGEDLYTGAVSTYTTLPEKPAIDHLYINATTLEGRVWNGTEWTVLIKPVTIDQEFNITSENAVSPKAIAAYLSAEIAKLPSADNTVSTLTWDSAEHILQAEMVDGTTQDIQFDGLGVSLSYVAESGEIQLLDSTGTKIGQAAKISAHQFVNSGEYNPDTKQIILYFDAEKTSSVTIDATGLIDIYVGQQSSSVNVAVSSDNKISANVKISQESGNCLILKEDGIYVGVPDVSGKMDKVTGATAGNIATLDADGNVVDSGTSLADLEASVGAIEIVKSGELSGSMATASDEKVISERALVESLTWKTTM